MSSRGGLAPKGRSEARPPTACFPNMGAINQRETLKPSLGSKKTLQKVFRKIQNVCLELKKMKNFLETKDVLQLVKNIKIAVELYRIL